MDGKVLAVQDGCHKLVYLKIKTNFKYIQKCEKIKLIITDLQMNNI